MGCGKVERIYHSNAVQNGLALGNFIHPVQITITSCVLEVGAIESEFVSALVMGGV